MHGVEGTRVSGDEETSGSTRRWARVAQTLPVTHIRKPVPALYMPVTQCALAHLLDPTHMHRLDRPCPLLMHGHLLPTECCRALRFALPLTCSSSSKTLPMPCSCTRSCWWLMGGVLSHTGRPLASRVCEGQTRHARTHAQTLLRLRGGGAACRHLRPNMCGCGGHGVGGVAATAAARRKERSRHTTVATIKTQTARGDVDDGRVT